MKLEEALQKRIDEMTSDIKSIEAFIESQDISSIAFQAGIITSGIFTAIRDQFQLLFNDLRTPDVLGKEIESSKEDTSSQKPISQGTAHYEYAHWPTCQRCEGTGTIQHGPYKGGTCYQCLTLGRVNPALSNEK